MGKVMQLQKATPPAPPSAARLKLAERIAELEAAEKTHSALVASLDWDGVASIGVRNAQDRLDRAHAALASVRQSAADNVLSGCANAASDIKAAREEIQEAEDALAVAADAKATLKTRVEPAERSLVWEKSYIEDAVAAVLREDGGEFLSALIVEIEGLHKKLIDRHMTLSWFIKNNVVKDKGPDQIGGLGELTTRFTYAPAQWRIAHTPHAAPSRDAWQAALAALKIDPLSAPLPEAFEI